MAKLLRCDSCKKLNDEPGVAVGRSFEVVEYRDRIITIEVQGRDLCRECVKEAIATKLVRLKEDGYND